MLTQYDLGMTTKIAVSLPDDLVAEAKAAVAAGRSASVSAYIAEAMRGVSRRETLREVLDDIFDEIGHPTPERRAWAREQLGLPPR
jgi:Arc/MetJ-type ribon-helix-helix transcriptional regulator